jgi:hypothetical protein
MFTTYIFLPPGSGAAAGNLGFGRTTDFTAAHNGKKIDSLVV